MAPAREAFFRNERLSDWGCCVADEIASVWSGVLLMFSFRELDVRNPPSVKSARETLLVRCIPLDLVREKRGSG